MITNAVADKAEEIVRFTNPYNGQPFEFVHFDLSEGVTIEMGRGLFHEAVWSTGGGYFTIEVKGQIFQIDSATVVKTGTHNEGKGPDYLLTFTEEGEFWLIQFGLSTPAEL